MGKDRMGGDGMGQDGRGWDGTGWEGMGWDRMGWGWDRTGQDWDPKGQDRTRMGQDRTGWDGKEQLLHLLQLLCMHMLQFFMVSSSIYLVLVGKLRLAVDPIALCLRTSPPFQSKQLRLAADPDDRTWP
jgi:hypothetical protein